MSMAKWAELDGKVKAYVIIADVIRFDDGKEWIDKVFLNREKARDYMMRKNAEDSEGIHYHYRTYHIGEE